MELKGEAPSRIAPGWAIPRRGSRRGLGDRSPRRVRPTATLFRPNPAWLTAPGMPHTTLVASSWTRILSTRLADAFAAAQSVLAHAGQHDAEGPGRTPARRNERARPPPADRSSPAALGACAASPRCMDFSTSMWKPPGATQTSPGTARPRPRLRARENRRRRQGVRPGAG